MSRSQTGRCVAAGRVADNLRTDQANRFDLDIGEQDAFDALFVAAERTAAQVACWSFPESARREIIVSFEQAQFDKRTCPSLVQLGSGFLISPFGHIDDGANIVFIAADGCVSIDQRRLSIEWQSRVNPGKILEFEKTLEACLQEQDTATPALNEVAESDFDRGRDRFVRSVQQGIEAIERGRFRKVVMARTLERALPGSFSMSRLFDSLSCLYPKTFLSVFSLPGLGIWIGASPEMLLVRDDRQVVNTVAMAGTMTSTPGSIGDWSFKDVNEHHLVSHYIGELFRDIGIRRFEKSEKSSMSVGHLFHIQEEFKVDLGDRENQGISLDSLVYGLHPTPAVGGLPKAPAISFINDKEGIDRKFYSGFLGPINFDNEIHLYVNIRCMNILDGKATLYAGAGITRHSEPDKEWQETCSKCQMMLRALEQAQF
jgi:isochorismate synthase